MVCHNRGWWIENYNLKTRAHHNLRKDAVAQHAPCNRVTINLGEDRQKYRQKVVNGNRQRYRHNLNQLAGSGNTNDGEDEA
jgi:hypothetical protein